MDATFESGFCTTRVNSCDVPTLVSMKYSLQTGFASSDETMHSKKIDINLEDLVRARSCASLFLFHFDWIYATVYPLLTRNAAHNRHEMKHSRFFIFKWIRNSWEVFFLHVIQSDFSTIIPIFKF